MSRRGHTTTTHDTRPSPTSAASLAKVLGYVGAKIVEPACARAPMTRAAVGADGVVTDPDVRRHVVEVLQALVRHVQASTQPDR